ncbi:MAG: hypothetical protein WC208_03420 [Gallionella sp.]|jgi:hypothetical protein
MVEKDALLSQYSEACHSVADKYIERSTRFGAADLAVLKASPHNHCFDIKIQHSLEVISDVKNYQGIVKHGESDFSTADWALYQDQVEKQAQSELGRKETLADLVAKVKSQSYAAISGRTHIRTHPRRLFHVYTCGGCHGSGKITCHNCGGSGAVNCSGCGGGGRVNCSCCHGSGRVSEQHQVRDYTGHYRSETRYRSCHHCSGGRVTCSGCGGTGRNTCRTCGGSGLVTCGTCAGHGYLTRVTSTDTYTVPKFSGHYPSGTPDYVHAALCKAGFSKLGQYGVIELDNVNMLHEQARTDFKYRSTMLFCELSLEIGGHQSSWVMYGSPPQIYDAGGILEALLKDDFTRLEMLGAGWSHMSPWFHRLAHRVITPFMASEVHQEIVNADYQGFGAGEIMDKVNRSLSEVYIERSLSQLRQSIQIAARWSSLKWILGIAIFSVPLILASIIFLQRSETHTLLVTQEHLPLFPWMSGSEFPWLIAIISIPISFTGWFLAKWTSKRWIRRAGGKQLVDWASRKGLLMGKWTAVAAIVLTATVSSTFFDKWPLWSIRPTIPSVQVNQFMQQV